MISKIVNFPPEVFSLVRKAFGYQQGALAFISAPFAYLFKGVMKNLVYKSGDQAGVLYQIFTPEIVKSIASVLLAFGVLTTVYIAVSIFDFITGLSASKKEHIISMGSSRGYIKSDKLWSSVWKFLGVIVIGAICGIFSMLFVVMSLDWLFDTFMLILILFFFVVISFDIHSIGENHQRRYGTKPSFYVFMDELAEVVKKGIIDRIKRKINP